ncbi:hypothetical protein VTK56DRAFT_5045 [Thermocarpiscus australiensis]
MSNEPNLTSQHEVPSDLKVRLKESYDAIAPAYNAWTQQHSPLRIHYLTRLLQLLPRRDFPPGSEPPTTALELGCGAGVPVTAALLAAGVHVTANDLSATQIALGQERLRAETERGRVRWVQGDMMGLSFPGGTFDVIVALYSVIHLPREEQGLLMERVAEWLRPGGLALVNFSGMEMEGEVVERWLDQEKGWMYWSGWGAEKTLEVVRERAGLEVLVEEVIKEEGVQDVEFLWVIARKPGEKDVS